MLSAVVKIEKNQKLIQLIEESPSWDRLHIWNNEVSFVSRNENASVENLLSEYCLQLSIIDDIELTSFDYVDDYTVKYHQTIIYDVIDNRLVKRGQT